MDSRACPWHLLNGCGRSDARFERTREFFQLLRDLKGIGHVRMKEDVMPYLFRLQSRQIPR